MTLGQIAFEAAQRHIDALHDDEGLAVKGLKWEGLTGEVRSIWESAAMAVNVEVARRYCRQVLEQSQLP